MQHIQGISRHQLQISSLEDKITAANPVRFIEAFVNPIDVVKLGFQSKIIKSEGRLSFSTDAFLSCIYTVISMEFAVPDDSKNNFFAISKNNGTNCAIAFGTNGKNLNERGKIS